MFQRVLSLIYILATLGGTLAVQSTQEWKDAMLKAHNDLRDGVYPMSSDMNYVQWDPKLERLARKAAEKCVFQHNYYGEYAGLGENIFYGGYTTPQRAAMGWFAEHRNYTMETATCDKGESCGHFTQIAAYTVSRIGCGYHKCPDGWKYMFCEYNRGARNPPFHSGPACASCMKDFDWCVNGFCMTTALADSKFPGKKVCKRIPQHCGRGDDSDCFVGCPSGAGGSVCQDIDDPRKKHFPECYGKCLKNGTPCLNGGNETSDYVCQCKCPTNYFGSYCETSRPQIDASVSFKIRGKVFDKGAIFPVGPRKFRYEVLPELAKELSSAINAFCSSSENFTKCCPDAIRPPGSLVSHKDIHIPKTYPRMQPKAEDLLVALFVSLQNVRYCPGADHLPPKGFAEILSLVLPNSKSIKAVGTTHSVSAKVIENSGVRKREVDEEEEKEDDYNADSDQLLDQN